MLTRYLGFAANPDPPAIQKTCGSWLASDGVRPVDEFIGRATAFAGKPGSYGGFVANLILWLPNKP
jgi:hypothetical protein